jgi:hypothetical protein
VVPDTGIQVKLPMNDEGDLMIGVDHEDAEGTEQLSLFD